MPVLWHSSLNYVRPNGAGAAKIRADLGEYEFCPEKSCFACSAIIENHSRETTCDDDSRNLQTQKSKNPERGAILDSPG
jgi:hypothetical protein